MLAAILAATLVVPVGIGGGETPPPIPPRVARAATTPAVAVAATTTDLRDLVAAVGGDRVGVDSLTDPRQDPHAREIVPRQVALLKSAALLVRVGLDHEPWLPRAVAAAGAAPRDVDVARAVVVLDSDVPRLSAGARPHLHAYGNPHYWLDPENARPITARARLVVVHDTWPYFARRFGLVIAGAVEEQPGVPPSPGHLGRLIERMRAAGVRVIVAEPGASPAIVRRLVDATGARVATLAPSVGAEAAATDYLALFDVNVERLARALGGEAATPAGAPRP